MRPPSRAAAAEEEGMLAEGSDAEVGLLIRTEEARGMSRWEELPRILAVATLVATAIAAAFVVAVCRPEPFHAGLSASIEAQAVKYAVLGSATSPGKCGEVKSGVDYVVKGGWYDTLDDIADPDDCCAMCQQTEECQSWTWVGPDAGLPATNSGQCWRKGGLPSAENPKAGVISGLRAPVAAATAVDAGSAAAAADAGAADSAAAAEVSAKGDAATASIASDAAEVHAAYPDAADCAAHNDDCSVTQCCAAEGMQCYEKDAGGSAMCRVSCSGADGTEDWTCNKLGKRKPDNSTVMGSWPGEECGHTRRCNREGFTCYQKNKFFSACKKDGDCEAGEADPNDPTGEPWSCKRLGGWRPPFPIATVPKAQAMGVTLYCFSVSFGGNKATPEEVDLVAYQRNRSLGIFGCDGFKVYTGASATQAKWKSVANTDIFIQVWNQVSADGQYWNYDWVVKADTDAVFFPQRLKWHLQELSPPRGSEVYIKNCDFKFGFQGSLEIVSTPAIKTYFREQWKCSGGSHLGHNGGEDHYFKLCMDALGVAPMKDASILNDKYTWTKAYNMTDVTYCHNGWTAAFHPAKQVTLWRDCYKQAVKAKTEQDAKASAAAPAPTVVIPLQ